ncbi:MAG: serine hydrolase [Candidatus Eremiobacteraeota bacterium]|nr:serine hydrolase [Candidatus Eremiobacteraeota bacterium]MBV9698614.1 serine hydrolase [Candidatus Eremiobacteraeota bacterium]
MKRVAFLHGCGAALVGAPALAQTSLRERIAAVARSMPGDIGVYARTMAAQLPVISYAARDHFPTASTIKVLIMATAFRAEELHPGALEERVTFHESQLIGGSDFMDQVSDGARLSVRELLYPMITLSDNTAANLLIEHFGLHAINGMAKRAGMLRTRLARRFMDFSAIVHHHDNVSTPSDMARLLYLLEQGAREGTPTIISPRHCRAAISIMLQQTDRDGIPAALPSGTRVANKTGELEGTRNDIAIVEPFGDSPFVLAIMTRGAYDYSAAYRAIHTVTRLAYAAVAGTET